MTDSKRRAFVAVAASAVGAVLGVPGVGHAYLRAWGRAFAWFAFIFGVGILLIGVFTDPTTVTPETLPLEVIVPLVVLLAVHTADAYYVARRSSQSRPSDAGGATENCPSCGRDLDPELSFCPWCAGSKTDDAVDRRE